MQTDMHFYGTYVLARAAGISQRDAKTIAYAAQFVDDSTQQDSEPHSDGGLLYGIATAHHDKQCVLNSKVKPDEQRRVWVPFHFLPGGVGKTLEERLLCTQDSMIAREMIKHHIEKAAAHCKFGFELLGIAAHVYMDTFSHYGFSGIGSKYNDVKNDTLKFVGVKNKEIERYIESKAVKFIAKYTSRTIATSLLEKRADMLGHSGTLTYPDRPYLHWNVQFEKPRPENGTISVRNNPGTYLEGCKKIHGYFSRFARKYYAHSDSRPFDNFERKVNEILRFEGKKKDRIERWRSAIQEKTIYDSEPGEEQVSYDHREWEDEKDRFPERLSSTEVINTHIYRFHQAAALHRYYVLKELLPAHGIAVY